MKKKQTETYQRWERDWQRKLMNSSRKIVLPLLLKLVSLLIPLGGIITRQALTQACMKQYLGSLYTFISLAVCHCGYLFGRSKLLSGGLFLVKKWTRSTCLSQLSLTDTEEPKKSFLYNLSKQKGLSYFKNV
eukprot:UN32531